MLNLQVSQQPTPEAGRQEPAKAIGLMLFAGLVIATHFALKNIINYATQEFGIEAIFIISVLISISAVNLSYGHLPKSFKILIRSIGAVSLVYIFFGHVDIDGAMSWGSILYYSSIVFGVVGIIYKYSFIFVPINYILLYKLFLIKTFSVGITFLDFYTLIDTGGLLILVPIVWCASQSVLAKIENPKLSTIFAGSKSDFIEFAVLTAVALHFGNYFISAVAKMYLGETVFFWSLYNPTEYLVLAALENSALPVSFSESVVKYAYDQFSQARPVTNAVTVVGQFLCVFAIMRIDWSIIITIFYDIMHIAIAILSGIFFWKFIMLNAAIVASLRYMNLGPINHQAKWFLAGCVVFSSMVFNIGVFAWLDTRSLNHYRVYAITQDGEEFEVPSNYFLGMSITIAQNRVAWPKSGSFNTQTWGSTHSLDIMHQANDCNLSLIDGVDQVAPFYHSKKSIAQFLQTHHKLILSMVDEDGYFDYDLYPHHIFSVPWKFTSFKQLDKRTIVGYRYVAEAICLSMGDDGLNRDVKSSASFVISVVDQMQNSP